MATMNIVCFGFGQVAKNFIKKLNNDEVKFRLTTTSRENSKKKNFENIDYESLQFTEKSFDKNLISRFKEADHILLSYLFDIFCYHTQFLNDLPLLGFYPQRVVVLNHPS